MNAKIASVILAALVCGGCSTMGMYSNIAHDKGAEAYDEGLGASIAFMCNDTSVGSIKRRFGVSKEAMERWIQFCYGDNAILGSMTEPPKAAPATNTPPNL